MVGMATRAPDGANKGGFHGILAGVRMIGKIFLLKIKTGFVIEKLLFRAHGDMLNSWRMITMMILIMVKALDMMMGRSRFSVVVERGLTVGWQSPHRVSMNHLVCPLIPTSHPLPSQYPLKACKPL